MEVVVQFIMDFWSVLADMAPYLLFGFFVAGLLSVYISASFVERHLGGGGIWPVVKASFWGVPLPLCSCGVIPVAASLRKHGSSKGATTSFLLSTPQTGVDSIMVTFSLLGPVFAIFRPIAAFITGLLGGGLVDLSEPGEGQNDTETREDGICCSACAAQEKKSSRFFEGLKYGFITLPADIARDLLIGLIAAGLITALLPDDFFTGLVGTGLGSMLIMMLAGIPVYVCATASVPIAAALMLKGVSPGAAFVFLMTGPATNAAAIAIFKNLLGYRALFIYLGVTAGCALGFGMLLNVIFRAAELPELDAMSGMLPAPVKYAAAVVLIAVILYALLSKARRPAGA
jgi:hypothetical protein